MPGSSLPAGPHRSGQLPERGRHLLQRRNPGAEHRHPLQRGQERAGYVKNQDDFKFVDGRVQLPVRPGLGVDVNKELVLEENKTPHEWKNPVWRHKDGSVAEW